MDRNTAKLHYERNCLAVAFIRLAQRMGWPLGSRVARKGEAFSPTVIVTLPQGQVSWAFPRDFFDRHLADLPRFAGEFQEDPEAVKFERLLAWPQP